MISISPFILLAFLWALRTLKIILFYIYLWQLKEYHVGRFLDHFRTYKGKQLFLNPLKILKFVLIPGSFLFQVAFPFILAFIYVFESIIFIRDVLQGTFKRPVLTKKTSLILFVAAFFFIFIPVALYVSFRNNLGAFSRELLYNDIFAPIFVSIIVLCLQPFAVWRRNRVIKAAKAKRAQFSDLLVIGITGSYGKTSTKEFLYTILTEKYGTKVLKTRAHQNSEIGISRCILNDLKQEHEIFIVEMGAYNKGGIKLLCDIARPKIGILTGINEQHMATFGSQENIIKTKYELIESLPEDGKAFFNAKNAHCLNLYDKTLRRGSGQAQFKKFLYGQNAKFFGEENILGAIAVARELGMYEEEIQDAVSKIENKMPGIKIKDGINGLKIIDATYSANPDGVIANLEYLRNFNGQPFNQFRARKIIVMPCLIELGKASKEVHARIGKKIAEICDLAIITTKDRFLEIKKGAASVEVLPDQKCEILFIEHPKKIFEKIKNFCHPGDTILLESRVPKQLIKQLANNN